MFPLTTAPRGILTGILTAALAISVLPDADPAMSDLVVRGTDTDAVAAAVLAHGGEVEFEIDLIDGVAAQVPTALVDELTADVRTTEVSPDAPIELYSLSSIESTVGQTPGAAVAALGGAGMVAAGYDGSGIDVAVIDSGIDTRALPNSAVKNGVDISMSTSNVRDGYGHGTAMAGIIHGVAPDSKVVDVKVADERGLADVSQVLAGIDWTVSNRNSGGRNIRVLSLAFGTDGTNDASTSPLAYAVEAAWRHGIVVVLAAGNHGDALGRLSTPAISPWVIAVGAADTRTATPATLSATTVPAWSAFGDGRRSPDVVAPGRSILGGLAADSAVAQGNPDAIVDGKLLGSGTSQATAFTAGVAAAMLEARPSLTPDQVKGLMTSTATSLTANTRQAGYGVLNLGTLFSDRGVTARRLNIKDQKYTWSNGSGSLDGDRGSFVLQDADGNLLTGDNTVVGAFQRSTWTGSTWTGSTWTGSTWTGSTWTGSTWTGSTWTGSTWTGSTWTGSTWTGSTWTGSTWTNVLWGT